MMYGARIINEERDALAFALLQDFIREGFMAPDADVQVMWAYKYADSILQFKARESATPEPQQCKKCGGPMERRNVGTLDDPGQTIWVCPDCKGGL